jgi:hypothetical protein
MFNVKTLLVTEDVHYIDLLSLAALDGPVGKIVRALGEEWGGGDLKRLTSDGPRIGTVYVYRDEDDALHVSFVPRHSQSVAGFKSQEP